MITATQPTITPATPAPANSSVGSIVATVIGSLVMIGGIGLAILGGALAAIFGGDGTVASGSQPLSTPRAALVTSVADFSDIEDAADVIGDSRVRVSTTPKGSSHGLFVGIGPAEDVDRYLDSVPTDEVTDLDIDPFKMTREAHPGTKRAAPPASQDFWVAQGTGSNAELDWKIRNGEYRLVLMNADGSRGVNADGDFALELPHIGSVAWVLLAGGSLLAIGGLTAVVVSTRQRRRD